MKSFEKSTENINQGTLRNEQIEEIRELFQLALADGRLGNRELTRIQIFFYESELSVEDFAHIKNKVFQQVVQAAIADHIVTEQERSSIFRIAEQLGVSPEWKSWAKQKIHLHGS